jgi:hypothetical protein
VTSVTADGVVCLMSGGACGWVCVVGVFVLSGWVVCVMVVGSREWWCVVISGDGGGRLEVGGGWSQWAWVLVGWLQMGGGGWIMDVWCCVGSGCTPATINTQPLYSIGSLMR